MSDIESELLVLLDLEVSKVEIVSLCHILRLYFDDRFCVDLTSSWRLRSEKKTILGAADIDFYIEVDDSVLDEDDRDYAKKASSLIGKKLSSISMNNGDLYFEFSGKRYIDFFNLSSDQFSIIIRDIS